MTTDLMEAWSLEEGDQILINGTLLKIASIYDDEEGYRFFCVDEEGYGRSFTAPGEKKFRLVLDNLAEV